MVTLCTPKGVPGSVVPRVMVVRSTPEASAVRVSSMISDGMPSVCGSILPRRTISARDCGAVFLYDSRRTTSCWAVASVVCCASICVLEVAQLASRFGLNSRKYQATMRTIATTAAMM